MCNIATSHSNVIAPLPPGLRCRPHEKVLAVTENSL